ncbi:MAG: glycosyltransferase [Anaerolineales bacterium]|nr:glycosyltransferase [Anaerolineales bacterium]
MPDRVAVAIPCYNEEITIQKVVTDFKESLPQVDIFVFDNNSTDSSAALAKEANAFVIPVRQQGKGFVVRRIFEELSEYDAIIMVDGDDTYLAKDAPRLLDPVLTHKADMVVGNRLKSADDGSMVPLHQFGNRLIVWGVNRMFKTKFLDILSGYRVFGRCFIERIPLLTSGFEIETEMTLQALEENMTVIELPIGYQSRPDGSESKLNSFRDGYKIMLTAAILLRDHRPLWLFGLIASICWLIALIASLLRFVNFFSVTEISNTLLTGLMLLMFPVGSIFFAVGLILNTVNSRFKELKQLMYRNQRNKN